MKEGQIAVALNKQGNLPHIQGASLGEGLQGVEHSPIPLRQDAHGHAAGGMYYQAVNRANGFGHLGYGTVRNGYDVEVSILRNGLGAVTSAKGQYLMAGLCECFLQVRGYVAPPYQYCPICTRSHFSLSSF